MHIKEILSIVSITMNFASSVPYVLGIYRRQTKPHMFSWLIWGIVCATAGIIQLVEGGGAASWLFISNSFYCIGIATISIWLGTRDIKRSDWVILTIALSAIPVWVVTHTPIWSVLIVVAIDGIGYVPTVRKSWSKPFQETVLSWGLSVITFSTSILALEQYTLATYLYPATFAIVNTFFVIFLLIRRSVMLAQQSR